MFSVTFSLIQLFLFFQDIIFLFKILKFEPWLVWLSGLSAGLQTKGSLVQLPVRVHAWVAGQVPSGGINWMKIALSPSYPLSLKISKNKVF